MLFKLTCWTIHSSHPFLLWDARLQVDKQPKHQCIDPMIDTHAIINPKSKMSIHLGEILSCFKTRALTKGEIDNWEDHGVMLFTPDATRWDPNDEIFATEEDAFLPN